GNLEALQRDREANGFDGGVDGDGVLVNAVFQGPHDPEQRLRVVVTDRERGRLAQLRGMEQEDLSTGRFSDVDVGRIGPADAGPVWLVSGLLVLVPRLVRGHPRRDENEKRWEGVHRP